MKFLFNSLFFLPLTSCSQYLRYECALCKKYTPSIKNPNWFKWFEHFCYTSSEAKSLTCFYYNCQLDIHSTTFWKEWEKCNCIQEDADYLSFLLDDKKQLVESYKEEL